MMIPESPNNAPYGNPGYDPSDSLDVYQTKYANQLEAVQAQAVPNDLESTGKKAMRDGKFFIRSFHFRIVCIGPL